MKSKKLLTGALALSIAILGLSVYSYSLFDSYAENPAVIEKKIEATVMKKESEKQPDKKESVQKESVQKEEKKAIVPDAFKGFERVPYTVQRGDNAWSIQSSLTPEKDIETMLELVAETNGKTQLHPIYPGDNIFFLKDMVSTVAEASTEASSIEPDSTESEVVTSPSDTDNSVATASADKNTSAPIEKQPDKKPTSPAKDTVPSGVKINNQTSTNDIIAMAKSENNLSKNTVTIQYSPDVTVTLNNETRTGEVKRNYTYSQDIVEYGTKVDYQVVDTALEGNKAVIHVISPDAGSQSMFDISNELSALVKSSNGQVTTTDVYFYNNQESVNARNHKWSYSDGTPSKMSESTTFSF